MKRFKIINVILILSLLSGAWITAAFAQSGDDGLPDPVATPEVIETLPEENGSDIQTTQVPLANTGTFTQYLPLTYFRHPLATTFGFETWSISKGGGANEMVVAGASWVRRNGLLWSQVEPSRGARNWGTQANLETELKNAAQLGLNVILIVRSTPSWAQLYPGYSCGPIRSDSFQYFANFMKDVVARYSAPPYKVRYFEIWNEPDVDGRDMPFYGVDTVFGCWGDHSDYYYGGRYYGQMLQAIYPAIKSANPDAQVLVGGLLMDCMTSLCTDANLARASRFMEGILVSGASHSFDGVSFHAYDYYRGAFGSYYNPGWASASNTTGPTLIAKSSYLRNLLTSWGIGKKYLINSEVALICGKTGDEPECRGNTTFESTKAHFLTQAFTTAYLSGLLANSWYNVFGWRASGLMEESSLKHYPAYNSYAFAASQMSNTTGIYEVNLGAGIRAYEFTRVNKLLRVVWSLDGAWHNNVPVPVNTTNVWTWNDSQNKYIPMSSIPTKVNVGLAPIYIEHTP